MAKLDNDTEKYLELFQDSKFTEHDFVVILLSLLCKNGINKINEQVLAKKLYYYYKNDNFRELFQDIILMNGGVLDNQVDIHEGLYEEKFFSGNIYWNSMHSDLLNLRYNLNCDLSYYEKNLSEDGKLKIRKMAEELSMRKKVEQQSKKPLYIYGVNPNQIYTLVHGKSLSYLLSFELITDGDISLVQYNETNGDGQYHYESPMYPNEYRILKDNKVAYVNLKNASFAIKQGLCDDEICYSIANTELIEPEALEKVMNIANTKYNNDDFALNNQAPYVRKIILK